MKDTTVSAGSSPVDQPPAAAPAAPPAAEQTPAAGESSSDQPTRYMHFDNSMTEDEYRAMRGGFSLQFSRDRFDDDELTRGHLTFEERPTIRGDASGDHLAQVYEVGMATGGDKDHGALSFDLGYGIRGGVRVLGRQQLFAQAEAVVNGMFIHESRLGYGGDHQTVGIGGKVELGISLNFSRDDMRRYSLAVFSERSTDRSSSGISFQIGG